MVHALVTGGCGFIGSNLVDSLLHAGHRVTVVDNFSTGKRTNLEHVIDRVSIIEGDVRQQGKWTSAFEGVQWVFHLAALADIVPSIERPQEYFETNVTGTLNVLEASRKAGIERFVYAASSSCYGIPTQYPTSEEAAISPCYPYALTKYLGEQLVLHWARVYRIPAVSLRLFNAYGLRSRASGTYGAVFGIFLAQKLAGKPFTVVGDGTQSRDFVYVTDICRAFLIAAESGRIGEVYNVGSGKNISVNTLVQLLGGEKVHVPKRPGEPEITLADISKISRDFGWKPIVSFQQGVAMLVQEINYWRDAPVWDPAKIATATRDWFRYLSPTDQLTVHQ